MTTAMHRIALLLLLSLCCPGALAQDKPDAKAPESAPTIHLPLPWKAGEVLRYAFENAETKQSAAKRERTRLTSITELRTQRADKTGYEVHWTSHGSEHKTLEGDAAMDAVLLPAMRKMESVPMMVVLDADGAYVSVRNIEEMSARMREALAPVMRDALAAGMEAAPRSGAPGVDRKEVTAQADAALKGYLDNITSPKVLEAMATRQARNMAFFNAGGLEDGVSYEMETELENPTGGPNFPAKLTFGLWVSEDDPEDVFIEWTSTIDPAKGAAAIAETVKRLFGDDLALDPKDLPKQMAIEDTGLMLVHRPTGMVEMYEDERTTTFGETRNHERNRMRLLDAGHGHEWKEDAAGGDLPKEADKNEGAEGKAAEEFKSP